MNTRDIHVRHVFPIGFNFSRSLQQRIAPIPMGFAVRCCITKFCAERAKTCPIPMSQSLQVLAWFHRRTHTHTHRFNCASTSKDRQPLPWNQLLRRSNPEGTTWNLKPPKNKGSHPEMWANLLFNGNLGGPGTYLTGHMYMSSLSLHVPFNYCY